MFLARSPQARGYLAYMKGGGGNKYNNQKPMFSRSSFETSRRVCSSYTQLVSHNKMVELESTTFHFQLGGFGGIIIRNFESGISPKYVSLSLPFRHISIASGQHDIREQSSKKKSASSLFPNEHTSSNQKITHQKTKIRRHLQDSLV